MKFSSRHVLLLAALAVESCHAFVSQKPSFALSNVNRQVIHQESCSAVQTSSRTALAMSFFEDFVASSDEKTRKADNDKYLAQLQGRVDRINGLEASVEDLGDDELQAKTAEFKKRLADGEDINGSLLEEAFAVVREAAW